ncbi:MAG: histidine kinase [Chitinophagaceae bacterium]
MKRNIYILLHVLAWLLLLSGDIYDMAQSPGASVTKSIADSGLPKPVFYVIFELCYKLVMMTGFYGFYFFVGPAVFVLKKPVKAAVLIIAVLLAMVLVRYVVEFHVLVPFLKFHNYFGGTPGLWWYIQNCIGYSYISCLFGLLVYFIMASQKAERERKETEKAKVQAELSFLRSQVNPHFLFNTINDIYALTYQKSDLAPEALLKLSGILRYMLYEGNRDLVSLQKELEYMEDYIALQRIGHKDQLQLLTNIEGDAGNQQIAPLLLIPFIENIFKHGVLDDPANPARLHITITPQQLTLECSNLVKKQQKDAVSGIGLHNVERRLQLLYPGKHTFVVKEEANIFHCSLLLQTGK